MGGAPGVGVLIGRLLENRGGVWRMKYMKRQGNCVVAGIFLRSPKKVQKSSSDGYIVAT